MIKKPFIYVLFRGIPENPDVRKLYGEGDQQLNTLAQVLASDSRWRRMESVTLIVRYQPSPVIGVMGRFSESERARIEALPAQVNQALGHLRYVDYSQAELDCERLAEHLVKEIGASELKNFCFAAIPRGGLIVLGMLAYTLDLSPAQLETQPDLPLVVVDDCTISGLRFRQFLNSTPHENIVFASLYAHPLLREAILAQEPRVKGCVSAEDLKDYAPEYYRDAYETWRSTWQKRESEHIYWVGMPEHVCFAWNEPDIGIWNPVTESKEQGWRVVPEAFCLKNRFKNHQPAVNIQYQPTARGELKPAEDVLFGELDGQIVTANIETGTNFILENVSADMWRAVINADNLEAAVQFLWNIYHVDLQTLQSDFYEFIETMQEKGMLVRYHNSF